MSCFQVWWMIFGMVVHGGARKMARTMARYCTSASSTMPSAKYSGRGRRFRLPGLDGNIGSVCDRLYL